ncbi:efflux RND transporter permease subunit (plasmid) [Nostoc sp. C052]|uniref:efflux RND transporter permease subunit n=1 Tax=Nostoc sp. C052 TaxID=2576902 RepID=UPI0015C402C5|nr:efflux RND transporter permease subunit [Nostoc sp. C052]QLE45866.1 efflux RND transporter permease subunit [Nostoc sp. C052]
MTTIAALCGFLPLLLSSGAGAASRTSLGTAVFGGLLVSVIMSLLLVPVLYVVVKNLTHFASKGRPPKPPQSPEPTPSRELPSFNGNFIIQNFAQFIVKVTIIEGISALQL